jgi:chromosome transmission fidelity protein 18
MIREKEEEEARKKKKQRVTKQDEKNPLWVDKYRPETYSELMGDQRLNRDVLRWVKQWDHCVFGKKPNEESQRDKVMRQYKSTFNTNPKFQAYKKNNEVVKCVSTFISIYANIFT